MKQQFVNHSIDSRHWDKFTYRSGDVVITSWGKSGTTWVQQIVGQLLFNGSPDLILSYASIWLDASWPSEEAKLRFLEKQKHRRFIKSHLSAEFLPRSPVAKYLYVGRDARDAVWSLHNHLLHLPEETYNFLNAQTPVGVAHLQRPDPDVYRFWQRWVEDDAWPMWPFWSHLGTWWNLRHEPNVLFVHFADLKRDMAEEIHRIADFLEVDPPGETWRDVLKHCSFDWMKANPGNVLPLGMVQAKDTSSAFLNKGTNCRWGEVLSEKDNSDYERTAKQKLGEGCAEWMLNGRSTEKKSRKLSKCNGS